MAQIRSIAVLGAGAMGGPIADNLEAAGFDVRRFDPVAERSTASSPAAAAAGADAILTMTPDGASAEQVVLGSAGAASTLADAGLWLQCATIGVEATELLAARAAARGLVFVDAPVLGTTTHARAAGLHVIASGPPGAEQLCAPVFDAISRRSDWIGEAGAASRLKIVFNAWLHTLVANVAEAVALARALGVDPELFFEVVAISPAASPMLRIAGDDMLRGSFEPGLTVEHARKDALLIVDAARTAGVAPHMTEAMLALLDRALALGLADRSFAAMVLATGS
jgi:3-hydroxyisobutyrate dehydrogenase